MEAEDLELAAEFCKLVGAPNLLVYLGLDESADPGDARARLKARRKFMQGMQGNPKYKREALFLIRHFTGLCEVLNDVPGYISDAMRRAESEHLPVIEMTVRGVLAGGSLSDDQVQYLRRNAAELGVTEVTFWHVLNRVAAEIGVPVHETPPSPASPPEPPVDLYTLLGIAPTANEDDVRIAYTRRLEELDELTDPEAGEALRRRIEIARKVLQNEAARRSYDFTATRTGPPARVREVRPEPKVLGKTLESRIVDNAATAPPVRERTNEPRSVGVRPSRLEILGEPIRTLRLGPGITVVTIVIRNGGDGGMPGTVVSDVRWMAVDPPRLDPVARQQTISVQVDRADVPENATSAVVTIQTEQGERARVVFEVRRGLSPWIVGSATAAVLVVVMAGLEALRRWW